jgi:hypothetical protein
MLAETSGARDDHKAGEVMKYRAQERQTLEWYVKMMACLDSLSPEERAGFDKWDRERNADQTTSDWPGFERYIGKRPSAQLRAS